MKNFRHHGDFDEIDSQYPECTQYVTSDVTLDVQGSPATQVNATIEGYGQTPNGEPRFLLTVWNSKTKPIPESFTLTLGQDQIGLAAAKTRSRKPRKK